MDAIKQAIGLDRLEERTKAVAAQKQRHITVACDTILRLVRVARAAKAAIAAEDGALYMREVDAAKDDLRAALEELK
jgi:hypothetical protein